MHHMQLTYFMYKYIMLPFIDYLWLWFGVHNGHWEAFIIHYTLQSVRYVHVISSAIVFAVLYAASCHISLYYKIKKNRLFL